MESNKKYLDENLSFEERVDDLISHMTIEEKTSQMVHNSPAVKRLNIPSYNWWSEALHGVARAGVATVFPQAIGLAATFNEDLIFDVAEIISNEARAKFHEFQKKEDIDIFKGLTFWSPNINIFRDPRWGRGHETYGEDPYLTGKLGISFIKGLQGNNKKYLKVAACVKHFAVHSGPESLRHSFDAVVTKKDLYETYLPAFKECIEEADVEAVMGAYNRTNGEPCCGSKTLLKEILRKDWNFKGHVVSDCWAIKDFHENHMVTKTAPESIALAIKNGCDVNCGNTYLHLMIAYKEGLVTEQEIDTSLKRLFMTRMKLGLFDSNEKVEYTKIPYEYNDSLENRKFSLKASEESLVLLKNDNLLPLDKNKIKKVAVIGPNANNIVALEGNYNGTSSEYVTVLEGIRKNTSDDTRIFYAEGCHLYKDKIGVLAKPKNTFSEAVSAAEHSDVVIMCMGLNSTIEGEEGDVSNEFSGGDKNNLDLPGVQSDLIKEIHKTGKPIILVLLSGSSLAVDWADENIPAIIQGWYPGAQGGNTIAKLIFGDYSPSGKLPVTFYRKNDTLPDFTDYNMTNRTYRYMKNDALYPFGYGLSYTKFKYSDLNLSSKKIKKGESITCTVKVKNIGLMDSFEAIELYLKDNESSVPVPKWQLKGIKKIFLKKNEEKSVNFEVLPKHMKIIDNDGKELLEEGEFTIYIGGNQPDNRSIKLTKNNPLSDKFIVY
jgi:beta-glucosidase